MERTITLRTFCAVLIVGVVGHVLLSFSALAAASGGTDRTLARLALEVARFPALVGQAVDDVTTTLGDGPDPHRSVPREVTDLSGFAPLQAAAGVDAPRIVMAGGARADRGWRVLGGAFAFEDGVQNAVALIDPDFTIRHVWRLREDPALGAMQPDARKILHGLAVLPDASIVVTFDNGRSVQRLDACGNVAWAHPGWYHHAVSVDPDRGWLWAMNRFPPGAPLDADYSAPRESFVAFDIETGEVVRSLSVAEMIAANPDLGLLQIVRQEADSVTRNDRADTGRWFADPFHFNDLDPLPAARAGAFPMFEAGDLVVSARSLNAVFVVDPDTARIKWHRAGATMRQHDPDWRPDGTIEVFDNRMGRGPSRIVAFDPATLERRVVHDGASTAFFTRIRGKQDRTARGDLAIVSPQQGRAFEVDDDGRVTAEFYNLGPEGSGTNLALTEFLWVAETRLSLKETDPCPAS